MPNQEQNKQNVENNNPVLANVVRGGVVESVHRGSAVVVNAAGEVVFSIGDAERMVFPRSSLKFLQAIPLVESGAAEAFGLSDREVSLACASHNGEGFHVESVNDWLGRLSLDANDLECGAELPINQATAHQLIAEGVIPDRSHHNCSGKHSGMLTLAKHLGLETAGYSEYGHGSQAAWMQVIGELTGVDIFSLDWERDGCGLPAICMPMDKLAYGFARFTSDEGLSAERVAAMARITRSVAQYPEMIAGTTRCCTAVIQKTAGKVLVKTGAEGVFAGFVPALGLGFVLKADDGATRGSEVMLGGLLQRLGALDETETAALAPWFAPEIKNSQGWVTGQIAASEAWLD